MRFGKQLLSRIYAPWSSHYFDYKGAKKRIKRINIAAGLMQPKGKMIVGSVEDEKELFKNYMFAQLFRISDFYKQKEIEAVSRYAEVAEDARQMLLAPLYDDMDMQPVNALYDIFEDLQRLDEYGRLNYMAFLKILKKYDKNTSSKLKDEVLPHLVRQPFYISQALPALLEDAHRLTSALADRYPAARRRQSLAMNNSILLRYATKAFSISLNRQILYLTIAFVVEVALIRFFGHEVQASGCDVTRFMHSFRHHIFDEISDFIHNVITSQAWALLSAIVFWAVNSNTGANLYSFVIVGFAIKSLAKNIIRSPRCFWLCDTYRAFYCGKGYSLPSGHSMVSLSALGFATLKFRRPWMFAVTILYEIVVLLNVQYIGTHTLMDVVVGWTCAALLLALFRLGERRLYAAYLVHRKRPSMAVQAAIVTLMTLCTLALDFYVEAYRPVLPDSYQASMERVCGFAPGAGGHRMYLRMYFSNTPLVFGVGVGYLLMKRLGRDVQDSLSQVERLFLAAFCGMVFLMLPAWIKVTVAALGGPLKYGFYHLYNFLSPIWVLYVGPAMFMAGRRMLYGSLQMNPIVPAKKID
eukprot:Opistho-2@58718